VLLRIAFSPFSDLLNQDEFSHYDSSSLTRMIDVLKSGVPLEPAYSIKRLMYHRLPSETDDDGKTGRETMAYLDLAGHSTKKGPETSTRASSPLNGVNLYRAMFNEAMEVQGKRLVATFGGNVVVLLRRCLATTASPQGQHSVARRLILSPSKRPPTPEAPIGLYSEQQHINQYCPTAANKPFLPSPGSGSGSGSSTCFECGQVFDNGGYFRRKYCRPCWKEVSGHNRYQGNRSRPPLYSASSYGAQPRQLFRTRHNSGGESSYATSFSCSSSDENAPSSGGGTAAVSRDMLLLPCRNRVQGCPFMAASAEDLRRHQASGCAYSCHCPWHGCSYQV